MPLTTLDENQRNAKESLHLWLSETQLNQLLEYNFLDSYRAQAGQGKSIADLTWDTNHTQSYQSLCFWPDSVLPQQTCCTFQMELGLLQRTTEELHQSLSNYLGRWHKELLSLRTALRDEVIQSLETLKITLNQTLCSYELLKPVKEFAQAISSNRSWSCWQHTVELISKLRLVLEQSFITQDDIILDLMFPIDNFLMQSLLETSCQTHITDTKNIQAEELDEKIKCHEYCQARLNLIFDSLTGHSDLPSLTRKSRNLLVNNNNNNNKASKNTLSRQSKSSQVNKDEDEYTMGNEIRTLRRRNTKSQYTTPTTTTNKNNKNNNNNNNDSNQIVDAEQFRLLYRPELVFTFRLNRKLIQSLELGESLIDGLKNFNIAQGTCMRKLMRMHHCALCAGETLSRPCPGLCLRILLNCLKPLNQLNPHWHRFTETIKGVAEMLLEKPHLRLEYQLKDFPERLVNYYYQLLNTYHNWLQPQCSGIVKLYGVFSLIKNNLKSVQQRTSRKTEEHYLKNYKKVFEQIKTTMDDVTNIWSRSGVALCLESPYLALTNGRHDQCWNGTAISSFNEEKCTFCQQETKDSVVTQSHYTTTNNKNEKSTVPSSSRRQRTSFIPSSDSKQTSTSETDDLLSASIASTNYLLNNPSWNSPLQHDKELAFRRANEILVRASRDLEWSVKTLLAETNFYNSLSSTKSFSNGNEDVNRAGVQIPISEKNRSAGSRQYDFNRKSANSQSDMTNSFGALAYGSILGWNAPEEEGDEERRRLVTNTRSRSPSSFDSSSKPVRMSMNQEKSNNKKKNSTDKTQTSKVLERNPNVGSGFIPGWPLYAWTPINSPAKDNPYEKPVESNFPQQEINYDGSGFHNPKDSIPPSGEYDYPQMFPFVNMNSQGVVNTPNSRSNENLTQTTNRLQKPNINNNNNQKPVINPSNMHKTNQTNSNKDSNEEKKKTKKNASDRVHSLSLKYYYIIGVSFSVMMHWFSSLTV
ncbi:unnamed protein product [Trichobilharzia szidati]|nr:unnamed protein product [Trichobilharzia szidati]